MIRPRTEGYGLSYSCSNYLGGWRNATVSSGCSIHDTPSQIKWRIEHLEREVQELKARLNPPQEMHHAAFRSAINGHSAAYLCSVYDAPQTHVGQSREENAILHFQRTMGNQAVQQLLQTTPEGLKTVSETSASGRSGRGFSRLAVHATAPVTIPSHLAVKTPGDIDAGEADRVAEQAMRQPEPPLRPRAPAGEGAPRVSAQGTVARTPTPSGMTSCSALAPGPPTPPTDAGS